MTAPLPPQSPGTRSPGTRSPEDPSGGYGPPRLLVLAPMRIEHLALGPSGRVGPTAFVIERTGMGLTRADRSARRLSRTLPPPGLAPAAVALAGLGGGLRDDLQPGDLVVAERVIEPTGEEVVRLASAPLLAAELRRLGLRARTGTVVSSDHIVTGAERAALAALGADVVDMESTAIARAPWPVPLAVLRAVSDSPDKELFSPAGVAGALPRSSRPPRVAASAGQLGGGGRAKGSIFGRTALVLRRRPAGHRDGRTSPPTLWPPVYVRRQIVHNAHVVSRLEAAGAVFVEELAEVPDGANVVFSAHGVGTSVRDEAERRHMSAIDATCPLVAKVHTEARRFSTAGRQVVLIGHAGHDEVEGTLGTVPGITLVSEPQDVQDLDLDPSRPTAIVTQTTLATDEVKGVVAALEDRFVDLARPAASDICYASQNRQEAVREIAVACDLVLVVGSANSSNSNRLVEVAERSGRPGAPGRQQGRRPPVVARRGAADRRDGRSVHPGRTRRRSRRLPGWARPCLVGRTLCPPRACYFPPSPGGSLRWVFPCARASKSAPTWHNKSWPAGRNSLLLSSWNLFSPATWSATGAAKSSTQRTSSAKG